jgi:predicted ester cyclase
LKEESPFGSAPKPRRPRKKPEEKKNPYFPDKLEAIEKEPLLYTYFYQFEFGSLIRKIFGREKAPHEEDETTLMHRLDAHYALLKKHELYWVDAFLVKKDTTFMGNKWISETSRVNDRLTFHVLHRGNICYIRMNEVDPEKRFAEVEFFDFSRQQIMVVRVSADFVERNWLNGKRLRKLRDDRIYDLRPRFRRLPFYKGPIRDGTLLEDCGITAKVRKLLTRGGGKTVEEEALPLQEVPEKS